MPHQCTTCERTFPDGSKEMLSGCPDCGGNTFQFIPKGERPSPSEEPPDRPEPPGGSVTRKAARAGTAVRDWVSASGHDDGASTEGTSGGADSGRAGSGKEWPDQHAADRTGSDSEADDLIDADAADTGGEDSAQSAARSDIVTEEELSWAAASVDESADADPEEPEDDADESPGIDELRRELNEQFESIRIVDRGTYELNLMELYKRDEYIIALREDGRYVIEMPESFRGDR
ncbi:OapC/ArvC family zinc-ribbon domain-containing protein [Natronorarus salvus]|uniref:OapC/ArvC family zinc-ribbon domain-containing protein n=1 Tax=Natronorarus salvus TaxID=3117733 RepID=UPI002F261CB4